MKKISTLVIAFFALTNTGFSQLVYKDVASVFYSRCTSCHHTGASDYPLMNYTQTFGLISSIQNDLNINRMPPWNADTSYTRFQHERLITSSEKQLILNWITGGALKGDTTQAPPAPTYPPFQLIGNADLTLSIGTFTSTSASTDKYFCFSIPSGLTQDRILRAYEVVPGNKKIVHHAVITADTTGSYNSDLSGSCYNIPGNLTIGTYAPGSKATIFPSQGALKSGMYIKAGSKIIIQLHYPAGSNGQVDSTKLRLFFYPAGTTGVRRIYTSTPLQNWNMAIPANSVVPYSAYYPTSGTLPVALSSFAVMPHSHLICKSIIYYAVLPSVDTIPLVRVNNWHFEWQDYYTFKKLVKIPSGYRLYSKHIYDNTTNNPNNPNTPPINVYAGTSTTSEMLFDGMMYLYYQPGDELIDLESIINSDPLMGIKNNDQPGNIVDCFAYPNPFNNSVSLRYVLKSVSNVSIEITDLLGRKTGAYNLGKQTEGSHEWEWDGKNDRGDKVVPGVYFYKIKAGDFTFKNKIIKQD
ncbi:MAG: T9SS type A sorting domain-containing protein [Bacteroidia bacterium]